jgi:hypothetical protein
VLTAGYCAARSMAAVWERRQDAHLQKRAFLSFSEVTQQERNLSLTLQRLFLSQATDTARVCMQWWRDAIRRHLKLNYLTRRQMLQYIMSLARASFSAWKEYTHSMRVLSVTGRRIEDLFFRLTARAILHDWRSATSWERRMDAKSKAVERLVSGRLLHSGLHGWWECTRSRRTLRVTLTRLVGQKALVLSFAMLRAWERRAKRERSTRMKLLRIGSHAFRNALSSSFLRWARAAHDAADLSRRAKWVEGRVNSRRCGAVVVTWKQQAAEKKRLLLKGQRLLGDRRETLFPAP